MYNLVCEFLCGIGLFLFAIVLLNDKLKIGRNNIPKPIFRLFKQPLGAILTGCTFAAATQSSSAINSISVSLCDKNILPRKSFYYVVMGTNIGTTITAYIALVDKQSVLLSISSMIFFTTFIIFINKKENIKNLMLLLSSVSLIFCGLSTISKCIPRLVYIFDLSFFNSINPFIALILCTLFTAICQSSSLITVLIVKFGALGILSDVTAIFMIMGANIGTCATAFLASIGTKNDGISVALFNLFFNVVGVVLFAFLYSCHLLNWFLELNVAIDTKTALFHTLFNVITMLLFLPFIQEVDTLLCKEKRLKIT